MYTNVYVFVGVGVGVGVIATPTVFVGVGVVVGVADGDKLIVGVTVGVAVTVGVGVGDGIGKFFIGNTTKLLHVPIDSIFNDVVPTGMFCTTNGTSEIIVTGVVFNGVLEHELPKHSYML